MISSTQEKSRDYGYMEALKSLDPSSPEHAAIRNEMFQLYMPLVYKMKRNLVARAMKTHLLIDFEVEEYEIFAFEKFISAVNSIDLKKITDPSKFFLYIQYLGYLRSMNRDLIAHRIKIMNHESQILTSSEVKDGEPSSKKNFIEAQECGRTKSAEDESIDNMNRVVINKAVDYCLDKKFTKIQKDVFMLTTANKTVSSIAAILSMKKASVEAELLTIRRTLSECLLDFSAEANIELEYKVPVYPTAMGSSLGSPALA